MKSQQGCDLLVLTGGDILTDGDMSQRKSTHMSQRNLAIQQEQPGVGRAVGFAKM